MIDGEMHGDAALVESIRNDRMPDSPLKGAANILVMPNMEAARISYNLLRVSSSEG
ncbi:NADP-dependent malic enzyme [Klebsiella pneumoniae subsp. pneumoniae]|nr:NADP-dependent malic enzyme [Klebsiella pneumoniae subsp. pneumoniae]